MIQNKLQACQILGIPENASKEEQKTAFHNIVKKYHPDAIAAREQATGQAEPDKEKKLLYYRCAVQSYELLQKKRVDYYKVPNVAQPKNQSGKVVGSNPSKYGKIKSDSCNPYTRKRKEEQKKKEKLEQIQQRGKELLEAEQKQKEEKLLEQIRWIRIADIIRKTILSDSLKDENNQ